MLFVALDMPGDGILCPASEILSLMEMVGDLVAGFKLHQDLCSGWDEGVEARIKELAERHNFVVIEDRKLGDIGPVAQRILERFSRYAHFITVHGVSGAESLANMCVTALKTEIGILPVVEMSNKGSLLDGGELTKASVAMTHLEGISPAVSGCISQTCDLGPGKIRFTPGISTKAVAALDQQYNTPESRILNNGTCVLIVGTDVYGLKTPEERRAKIVEINDRSWAAYQQAIQ